MKGLSRGSSVKDYFGSSLSQLQRSCSEKISGNLRFQRFGVVRFSLLALLIVGLVGGASALSGDFDGFEDGDYTINPQWNLVQNNGGANVQTGTVFDGTYSLELVTNGSNFDYTHLQRDTGGITVEDSYTFSTWMKPGNADQPFYSIDNTQNDVDQTSDEVAAILRDGGKFGVRTSNSAGDSYLVTSQKSSFTYGEWYKAEIKFYPSTSTVDVFFYDSTNTQVESFKDVTYSGATSYQYVNVYSQNIEQDSSAFFDLVQYGPSTNNPPQFNSTTITPDPPLIGENVSYSECDYDPDGTVQYANLSVTYGGSTVVSDVQRTGEGCKDWNDVFTPQTGDKWLNATLSVVDDAGAVTTTEINRYLSNDDPEVNISAPIDEELYGSKTQNYEADITSNTDSKPGETVTYTVNLNGQEIEQASNTGDFNISNSFQASEGNNTLEVVADDGVNQASESVSFEVDSTAPEINISSPESFEPDRTNVLLNASVNDPNLNTCYYSLDGEENQTLVDCDTAQLVVGEIGQHEVTVYAEDTLGNMASESKTFEADYENSIKLEDSVSGSQIQEFQVGFQSNSSEVGAGGSTSDGEFNFNTSSLPTGNVTATFTANGYNTRQESFQVDDSFTLSESYQMERAGIFIEAFEEVSQESIEFDLFARNDAGEEYQAYNLTTFEREFENLPTDFPTGEVEIRIDDAESNYDNSAEFNQFRPREYVVTINENTRTNLKAQLLERGSGIFVTIETSDGSGNRVQGALINVQRNIVNGYTTVSTKKTQTDGSASFYLDPDTAYQVLASKQGFSSFQGTFSPVNYQAEPLQIALGTESDYVRSNTWDSIEYSLNPGDNRINLTGMQKFNYSVTDTQSGLEEVGIRVFNESGSKVGEQSVTGSPSGMGAEINLNLSNLDLEGGERLTALGYFVKEGESYTVQRTYTARKHIVPGLSSIVSLFDGAENLGDTTKGMIALMFSIVTGLSLQTRINSKGAGLISLGVLGIFVMTGWFNGFFFLITLFMLVGLYGSR